MDYKEKVIALLNSKELSKEQKEKLESIFPELREPEDERIKSAAIEFVIQNKSFNHYLGISKDDVVTWINRQGEQEAWSEEDKNMLKWVIGYLENKMLNTPISEERTACKNAIAWLKSLKGRVQSKQEWSEKDKAHIDSLLKRLEGMCKPDATFISTEFAISEDEDWLKSLRHRSQWKPSDEQIRTLELAIDYWKPNDVSVTTPLYNLLEQLKKLREE